ncbi:MAG: hypothetical protein R6X08_02005 [Desulfosalsimonadaceae bacterium]
MDFEIFFLFIIVGIVIFSRILQQMAGKGKKGAEKPASAGWKRGLGNFMEEFWQQMEGEPGASGHKPEKHVPELQEPELQEPEIQGPDTVGRGGLRQRLTESEKAGKEPEKGSVEAGADTGKSFSRPWRSWHQQVSGKDASRPRGSEISPGAESPRFFSLPASAKKEGAVSRRQLRSAVIWSEILARPVALRDMDD